MKSFKDLKPKFMSGFNKALAVCTAFVVGTGSAVALPPNTAPEVYDFNMNLQEDQLDAVVNQMNYPANWFDANGDGAVYMKITVLPTHGTLYLYQGLGNFVPITVGQELDQTESGTLTYIPDADYYGSDSFTYNMSDGNAYADNDATISVTITATNDAPTDVTLTSVNVDENQPIGSTVGFMSGVDVDAGDTHTFTLVSGPGDTDNGSFSIIANKLATGVEFDYETQSFYSVRIKATDAGGLSYEKPVTVTINNINDKPVCGDINKSVIQAQTLTLNSGWFINSFIDQDGDPMTKIQIASLPLYGTLELSGSPLYQGDQINTLDIDNLVYTAPSAFAGYDTIEFKGHDGTEYADVTAKISIKVLGNRSSSVGISNAPGVVFGNGGSSRPTPTSVDTTGSSGFGVFHGGVTRPTDATGTIPDSGSFDPTNNKTAPEPNGTIAGIENVAEAMIHSSYPNPFSNAVTIRYELPAEYNVVIKVYNELGQEVRTLADGIQNAGTQLISMDAAGLETGQYFYNIILTDAAGTQVATKAGIMMKMK